MDESRKIEALKVAYQLWSQDNLIGNQKLAMYLAVQSILVLALAREPGAHGVVSGFGVVLSLVWFLSIGRTVEFRDVWQEKIHSLLEGLGDGPKSDFRMYPSADRVKQIAFYGRLSSKYVLLGPTVAGFVFWVAMLFGI